MQLSSRILPELRWIYLQWLLATVSPLCNTSIAYALIMQISMNVQHLAPMTANRIVTIQLDHIHVVATQATPLTVMVALAQVNQSYL